MAALTQGGVPEACHVEEQAARVGAEDVRDVWGRVRQVTDSRCAFFRSIAPPEFIWAIRASCHQVQGAVVLGELGEGVAPAEARIQIKGLHCNRTVKRAGACPERVLEREKQSTPEVDDFRLRPCRRKQILELEGAGIRAVSPPQ